jgi:DNA-binding GntR family transcriptional regulator
VLAELRRVILAGDAPPGLTIPAEDVAAAFGVSVIPVREALKTLVGEGLVEHRTRGAYRVARLTRAELVELYVVRGTLELAALAGAAVRATAADHAPARERHDGLDRALRADDGRAYHRGSRLFHIALVEPSGMRRLQAMLEAAWNLTEPYQLMSHVGRSEREALHDEHREMLAAFTAGRTAELLVCAAAHHDHLRRVLVDPEEWPACGS